METTGGATLAGWGRARRYVGERIATMHPAYFAMSMATGIVSTACHLQGLRDLGAALFWINLCAYSVLWLATIARAIFFWSAVRTDWTSHQRSPGFFTSVAATCVLGMQFILLRDAPAVGMALWILGLLLWLVLTYSVFVALSVREEKPSLADGINGGWLLAVVATQSICVLGCRVLPGSVPDRDAALFVLTSLWLCGGMLYIWMISLIFYRYTFFRFSPSDLMPPYWINMGAVAISTLAGSALLAASGGSELMASIRPFVKGFTILYWATATWWIPMLLVLGIWRHKVRRVAFAYDPLYWGLVFPLGMYSVCTLRLVETLELPFLRWVSRGFLLVAIIAWMFTFFGWMTRFLYLMLLAARAARPAMPVRSLCPVTALESSSANQASPGGNR